VADDPSGNGDHPAQTVTEQIEVVCERFAAAWAAGRRPRIEEFLGSETVQKGPERLQNLLVELVKKVDLQWQWKSPSADSISSKRASDPTEGPEWLSWVNAIPRLMPPEGG
jgi:hypothetical protein